MNAKDLTVEQLKQILLTDDGLGKKVKERVLGELITRECNRVAAGCSHIMREKTEEFSKIIGISDKT